MTDNTEAERTVRIFNELVAAQEAHDQARALVSKTTADLHAAVRAASNDHVSLAAIMHITGLARSRIYQIRNTK